MGAEGGKYLLLRHTREGHEEAARGCHADVMRAWDILTEGHEHTSDPP